MGHQAGFTADPGTLRRTAFLLVFIAQSILAVIGLIVSGQIRFRKIDGWNKIIDVVKAENEELKKAS